MSEQLLWTGWSIAFWAKGMPCGIWTFGYMYPEADLDMCRPSQKHQIISLGAGTDTRFFRLAKRRLEEQGQEDQGGQHILEHHQTEHNKHHQNLDLLYHEIDFPFTTAAKIRSLEGSETTKELLTRCSPTYTISADRASLKSSTLNIHALDLRTFSASTDLPNLDPSAPTLILSEMCLTYLPSSTTISILQNLLNTLQNTTSIILYEPLHPTDPFGRTMIANLASRGIRLPGLEEVPTLEAQKTRLQGLGFEETQGRTVREWWDTEVDGQEKERLRGCEWVDEEEEWNLLGEHYGLIWGTRPPRAAEG